MTDTLRFPADVEHTGLRVAVVAAFLAAASLVCALSLSVVPQAGLLIAGAGALVIGLGTAALTERILKGRWRSGRELIIDAGGMRLLRNGRTEVAIDAGAPAELLRWRFQPRSRRHIPRGWYVVAFELSHDEHSIPVYTLMPGDLLETLVQADAFRTLQAPDAQAARDDMRLAGEQRRLQQAEVRRWTLGAELTQDDFILCHDHVTTLFG